MSGRSGQRLVGPGGRRAQLLLVGGVVLALALVGLGVLLDSVAYTQTVTAAYETDAGSGAFAYRSAATESVGGLLYYATYHGGESYGAMNDSFHSGHDQWVTEASTHYTTDGAAVDSQVLDTERGALLYQPTVEEFTSATDDNEWTLVDDAGGVRRFRLDVDPGLLSPFDPDDDNLPTADVFAINATGPDGERFVYVYNDEDGDPAVTVYEDGSLVGTCTGDGSGDFTVDLTGGTVDGEPCEPLSFPAVGDSVTLSYENADEVEGRYVLVVDRDHGNLSDSAFTAPSGSALPHSTSALYAATVRLAHRGPDVTYETDVRVTPEVTPEGPVYDYPTRPDCTGPLVYTDLSGGLHTVRANGSVTDYAPTSVKAIGPMHADVDGDDRLEIPYVNASGYLRTVDPSGQERTLASKADQTKTLMGAGTWGNGAFERQTAIYYVNVSDNDIWRAWYNDTSGTIERQEVRPKDGDGDGISAIAGIRDYNGDGDTDIVFADGSAKVTYADGGTTRETDENVGSNNGIGIGSPCDFDGDGSRRVPIVDGSNNVALLPPSGTSEDLTSSGPAAKSPLAGAEWDASASGREVVFVGSGEWLKYVTQSGTISNVTDSAGDPIAVDDDQGVA